MMTYSWKSIKIWELLFMLETFRIQLSTWSLMAVANWPFLTSKACDARRGQREGFGWIFVDCYKEKEKDVAKVKW